MQHCGDNAVRPPTPQFIKSSDTYDGDRFWTKAANGATVATPLLLALAVVEISDVIFAVDSIPAVFGVTLDPFIVYTSNIFAILSLRSLYSFVARCAPMTVCQGLPFHFRVLWVWFRTANQAILPTRSRLRRGVCGAGLRVGHVRGCWCPS